MAKLALPAIISANALLEGDVIYLAQSGGWTRALGAAAVAQDAAQAEALLAAAQAQPEAAVDPYLTQVALDGDAPRPLHFREAFRASGPTFRDDLRREVV